MDDFIEICTMIAFSSWLMYRAGLCLWRFFD